MLLSVANIVNQRISKNNSTEIGTEFHKNLSSIVSSYPSVPLGKPSPLDKSFAPPTQQLTSPFPASRHINNSLTVHLARF